MDHDIQVILNCPFSILKFRLALYILKYFSYHIRAE